MAGTDPMREVRRLFLEEASEQLELMNRELLSYEKRPEKAALNLVLRAAHSVKGTAGAASMSRVEAIVHNFESCVEALAQQQAPQESSFELLYRLLDHLEAAILSECSDQSADPASALPSEQDLAAEFGAALRLVPFVTARTTAAADDGAPGAPGSDARADEVSSLRVATDKIDRLMTCVEDLVQLKAGGGRRQRELHQLEAAVDALGRGLERLRGLLRETGGLGGHFLGTLDELRRHQETASSLSSEVSQDIRQHTHLLDGLAERLQDDIRSVRMVPVSQALTTLPRTVRDTSRKLGAQVHFDVEGGETEVDRDLVELVKDPLIHLVRNSIAHGHERPEVRARAGKSPELRIRVQAVSRAGGLDLIVHDDGRGIDPGLVRERAIEKNLITKADAQAMGPAELTQLVFLPGFSTAKQVDEISGRGVGLDLVRDRVESCGGSVQLESSPGIGTRFVLRLPLNLASMRMLIVSVGKQPFAIPVGAVERVLRVGAEDVHQVDGGLACTVGDRPVAVDRLAHVLGLRSAPDQLDRCPAIVLTSGAARAAVMVDSIDGEQELIVKRLGDHLLRIPNVSGATVLASGQIVPLLNAPDLVRALAMNRQHGDLFARESGESQQKSRILVVDDSITTRTLEKSILEAAGFFVQIATDGVDALEKLSSSTFDLVLSDFQMPRMDGLELVTRIKATEKLRRIPVVLVSSLASDDDRRRGLKAGADAYLGKGEFTQELLLQTLERLL